MTRSQWRGTVDDSGLQEEAASPTAESVYTEKTFHLRGEKEPPTGCGYFKDYV